MSIDRQKAIHRPRRVIFNDDNAPIHQETATTPEGYYAYRLDHVIDTHVDSVWISIMTSADNLLYNTNVGEVADSGEWPGVRKPGEESVIGRNLRMLIEQGTDPLQLVIDFCRKHDLEILASFRTNMIQDSWWPNCRTQWKRDHPELCLGDTENPWTVRGLGSRVEGHRGSGPQSRIHGVYDLHRHTC